MTINKPIDLNSQMRLYRLLAKAYRGAREEQLINLKAINLCQIPNNKQDLIRTYQMSTSYVHGYRAAMEISLGGLGGLNAKEVLDELDRQTWVDFGEGKPIELRKEDEIERMHKEAGWDRHLQLLEGGKKDND